METMSQHYSVLRLTKLFVTALLLSQPLVAGAQGASGEVLEQFIQQHCQSCVGHQVERSGLYILEKGEESLITRAWLAEKANASIDIQYFIWSTDNIGILAAEALLSAAERGVKVRVIVDDLLVDADNQDLIALNAHPNISIKIYNP